jgi:molybdate/tungstate transport system substrate-binding protein
MRRLLQLVPLLAMTLLPAAASAAEPVRVLYAGSLVNLMEHGVGPAFDKATGLSFQGFAAGSQGLANQIKGKLRQGDVFVSAAPGVNASLTGDANGNWVSWYVLFAQSPVVIGYNPRSRFAADLRGKPWYEVLQEPGIRIGRTDPKLDPKGLLTERLMQHAEQVYHQPGLAAHVLGDPENPAQVLPEETLIGRLQSGELDVGFFYSTETADAHIPAIALPKEVAEKAQYTVTVLNQAPNASGGARFVAFLLGRQGAALLKQHGLDLLPPTLSGDAQAVPAQVRALIPAAK